MIKENIYLTKKSDKRYELVTKDIMLDAGVYYFYELSASLFVLQKKQYIEPKQVEHQKPIEKEKLPEQKKEQEQQVKIEIPQEEDTNKTEPQKQHEWYQQALELKKKLGAQYLTLEEPEEVRKISYVLKNEINSGAVLGVRGFDKVYYIFRNEFYEKKKGALLDALKDGPISFSALLQKLGIKEELLKGLIELTKEQGEIIEPRKGTYKKV